MRIVTHKSATRGTRDYISIGNSPYEEPCTQVSSNDPEYPAKQKKECRALAGQLIRMNGEPPKGAEFAIMKNPHDFGTYYDLVVVFDTDIEEAVDYAFLCEDLPENWDGEALEYLKTETVG